MGISISLFIIGVCLIIFNVNAIKKEKGSFNNIYNQKKVDINEVNIEIGKLRREFAETLLELQTQIVDLEKDIKLKEKVIENNDEDYKDNKDFNDKITDILDVNFNNKKNTEDNIELKNNISNLRVKEVENYINDGLTVEEIADILKVGKGEILLIKELYLK